METHRLLSGRKISYELIGKGRRKIVYFHGFPGSRCQARLLLPHCDRFDIQVLAFDRPGYGHSDAMRTRGGKNPIPEIVKELVDAQGWTRFHLLAVSGGAPHALHSASRLQEQILSLHLVGGLGPLKEKQFRDEFSPMNYRLLQAVQRAPNFLLRAAVGSRLQKLKKSEYAPGGLIPGTCPSDRSAMEHPEVLPLMCEALESAFRQGTHGVKNDSAVYLSKWDLDWASIVCPVVLWHGTLDTIVPSVFSQIIASRLAQGKLNLIEGEGHYGLAINHIEKILSGIG